MELSHLPMVTLFIDFSLSLEVCLVSFTQIFPAFRHKLHHFFETQMRLVLHQLSLALFDINEVAVQPLLGFSLGWMPWLLNGLPVSSTMSLHRNL